MKFKLFALMSATLIIIGSAGCTTGTTAPTETLTSVSWANYYADTEELLMAADCIVIGEFDRITAVIEEKEAEARWGPIMNYATEYAFHIDQVVKGPELTEIIIHQTGVSGKQQIIDDPLFKVGEKSILFLREYEPSKYCVLGGPQGRYTIIDGKVYSMNYVIPDEAHIAEGLDTNGIDVKDFIEAIEK